MSAEREDKLEEPSVSRSSDISSSDTLAVAAPTLPRRISPPNVILFLDNNQDQREKRSTIQRHTAHHAAAQRREARLQSSRELVPRNLEWQRRPGVDTPVSSESDSTTPKVPTSTTPEIVEPVQQAMSKVETEQQSASDSSGAFSSKTIQDNTSSSIEAQGRPVSSPVLESIGEDELCNIFLRAYQLALQAQSFPAQDSQHWQAREGSLNQVDLGLGVLRQRLHSEDQSCSDETIQSVLVLFVYANKFQTPQEASSHRAALDQMIALRGGLASFSHREILEKQLQHYESGEVEQILHVSSGQGTP